MSIKYNEFGEVISVNGITTGHQLGTSMQDAIGTEEENSPYGTELSTVTRAENVVEDEQPKPQGGGGTDGRGIKTIEADTIEELFNKILSLDNPVVFRVTNDGVFIFKSGDMEGGFSFLNAIVTIETDDTYTYMDISEYSYFAEVGLEISFEYDIGSGATVMYGIYKNGSEICEIDSFDFSEVTKFTVYYF